jgi:hypothetical protein
MTWRRVLDRVVGHRHVGAERVELQVVRLQPEVARRRRSWSELTGRRCRRRRVARVGEVDGERAGRPAPRPRRS